MIKAEELRIGNVVMDSFNQFFVIKEISPGSHDGIGQPFDFIGQVVNNPNNPSRSILCMKDASPISLTPEILQMWGFDSQPQITKLGWVIYHTWKLEITVDPAENPFRNIDIHYNVNMANRVWLGKYPNMKLHQLQNLFYAVVGTGEELKLKTATPAATI